VSHPATPLAGAAILADILAARLDHPALTNPLNYPDGTGDGAAMYGMPMSVIAQRIKAINQEMQAAAAFPVWLPADTLQPHQPHVGSGPQWLPLFLEEAFAAAAETGPAKLRAALVRVAALTFAWIEAIDRRAVRPAGIAELLAAVAEQLPPDDPEKCAQTLAAMNERASGGEQQ
jgi:hypothetical protein